MQLRTKRDKFKFFQQSLASCGLQTSEPEMILCPLCWQEKRLSDLSLEHMVPSAVGGRSTTLTCRLCNNTHGSELDSHLINYQRANDAMHGHGRVRSRLNVNGYELVANLDLI